MSDQRYVFTIHIGPCSEKDADALADAIIDLPEFGRVGGGGIGMRGVADDDPLFLDDEVVA